MKHYYKDPLAAAWMAKYFGMQFMRTETSFYVPTRWIDAVDMSLRPESYKLYIAPDSLLLLELKHGDLIEWESYHGNNACYFFGEEVLPVGAKVIRVIERNGYSFMWPESESA